MKAPEQYDPSKPSSKDSTPPKPLQQVNAAKSPAIPVGTPTIKQTHKQTIPAVKNHLNGIFVA